MLARQNAHISQTESKSYFKIATPATVCAAAFGFLTLDILDADRWGMLLIFVRGKNAGKMRLLKKITDAETIGPELELLSEREQTTQIHARNTALMGFDAEDAIVRLSSANEAYCTSFSFV